jgi:hypothetical protein
MPSSTRTPVQTKSHATADDLARQCAIYIDDITGLGAACIDELRAVLAAIVSLSAEHEVIHDLAKLAVGLAEDRHSMLTLYQLTAKKKLEAIRAAAGGTHA